ncbi:unnamed protein product [Heterosigma akashiwo]
MSAGQKRVVIALYRSILKKCSLLSRFSAVAANQKLVYLQAPIDFQEWGSYSFLDKDYDQTVLQALIPESAHQFLPSSTLLKSDEPRNIVRRAFQQQAARSADSEQILERQADAFEALRSLGCQARLMQCTSVAETRGVWVMASAAQVHQEAFSQADAQDQGYLFSYRVRVENRSARTVQLVGRCWRIAGRAGRGRPRQGEPGVGPAAAPAPGEIFQYQSGTDLPTPTGFMEGSFQMVTLGGEDGESCPAESEEESKFFDAEVARFDLVAFDH